MKSFKFIIVTLALLVIPIASLAFFVPTSAHVTSKAPANCHYLVGGTRNQPCVYKPTEHKLSFTALDHGRAYQSNRITVLAGNWILKLECVTLGAGYPDEYDVSYLWYGYELPLETHAHLICDGQYHSEVFPFRFSHPVLVKTSRPVFAVIVF